MREKKYIKLRCDMYEDTKFKIIDTMENRDTINYIWTRILALCGKINNGYGELVISKGINYTIEILSLEFNRSREQVEEAINVFIDLNMMSQYENGVFIVCNFNKHQGKKKIKEEMNEIRETHDNEDINEKQNNKDSNENSIDINFSENKLKDSERNKNTDNTENNKTSSGFKSKLFTFNESSKNTDIDLNKISETHDKTRELKNKMGGAYYN